MEKVACFGSDQQVMMAYQILLKSIDKSAKNEILLKSIDKSAKKMKAVPLSHIDETLNEGQGH